MFRVSFFKSLSASTSLGSHCSHQSGCSYLPIPPFFLSFLPPSLPLFATVSVFSAKGSGTSGPSIMHSRDQLLTNHRPSRSRRLVSPLAEPYTSPPVFLSVWTPCSPVVCVDVCLLMWRYSLRKTPPQCLALSTRRSHIKSTAQQGGGIGQHVTEVFSRAVFVRQQLSEKVVLLIVFSSFDKVALFPAQVWDCEVNTVLKVLDIQFTFWHLDPKMFAKRPSINHLDVFARSPPQSLWSCTGYLANSFKCQLQIFLFFFCPGRDDAPTTARHCTKSSCVHVFYDSWATSKPHCWSHRGVEHYHTSNGFTLNFLQANIKAVGHCYCTGGCCSKHSYLFALCSDAWCVGVRLCHF